MQIVGEWLATDDGARRPIVRTRVAGADGTLSSAEFLIDTGADRTVLGAALLAKLGFPTNGSSPGYALEGIGGTAPFVLVNTVLEFTRDDGGPAPRPPT